MTQNIVEDRTFAGLSALPKAKYYSPTSVQEVIRILGKYGSDAMIIAGGTVLIVALRKLGILQGQIKALVDINRIKELRRITKSENAIKLGSTVTLAEIQEDPLVARFIPALKEAVDVIASPPIRNRATIGGDLCSALPEADSAPPLLVHDASVRIVGVNGERIVPLSQFFVGPYQTILEPTEILTEIIVPIPPETATSTFVKLGKRKAFASSIASAAAYVRIKDDKFEDVKVALGAVSLTPIRAKKVENALVGKRVSEEVIVEAAKLVKEEVEPFTDVKASAEYRREMSYVITKRALNIAVEKIRKVSK